MDKPTCSVCHRVAGKRKCPKSPTEIRNFQAYPLKHTSPILDETVEMTLQLVLKVLANNLFMTRQRKYAVRERIYKEEGII